MLSYSSDLAIVHYLKERFYMISNAKSSSEAKVLLKERIELYGLFCHAHFPLYHHYLLEYFQIYI